MLNQEAFTYCWTDHKDNKLYVGYHKGNSDDGYLCSSKWMLEEYSKRPEDFTRQIIAEGTAEDCHMLEVTILKAVDAMHSDRFYNQSNGDENFVCKCHTEETRDKIRNLRLGTRASEGTRGKMRIAQGGENHPFWGTKRPPETIKKMSNSQKGRTLSAEQIENISKRTSGEGNPMFGKHMPKELRNRLSDLNRGENNPFYGKHHTEETINKLRKPQKQLECPYCKMRGGNNMKRYHFKNCKQFLGEQ